MSTDVAACFNAHRARVYRWAYALCGRHEDARDVVQEVFLRMLKRPPELPAAAAAVSWLRQVTSRVVIDRWRAESSRQTARREYVVPATSEQAVETYELVERVRAALQTLSEQQRLVVMAKTYDGMTFRQIADELGIAVPTVKTHYVRALSAVRVRLNIAVEAGR
jgi:RNA polymerase sigma-70 factor (ECF subfamily)